MAGRRIGLFGGTFNPIHLGHLRAAVETAEDLALDEVHFILSATPPHKSPKPLAAYEDRLAMLKLSVEGQIGFVASDLESRLPAPSYTINTVKIFQKNFPGDTLFFLVGLDAFAAIASWRDYRALFENIHFAVFGRPGQVEPNQSEILNMLRDILDDGIDWDADENAFISPAGYKKIFFRPGCRLDISSTDLRQRLKSGKSVRYLVSEETRRYLIENKLYQ